MDANIYDIRRDLSRALAAVEEMATTYPNDPVVHAIDSLQSALSQLTDVVEELHREHLHTPHTHHTPAATHTAVIPPDAPHTRTSRWLTRRTTDPRP